jgi:GTP cyclohydrolase I
MTAENVVPLRTAPRIDHPRAERAVAELLAALGYPVEGEHRAMTPQRVANAFAEMLTPSTFLPTTFGNDEGYDELVVAREVPFRWLCEHPLLPFYGCAHVGYLPGGRIVGLSKLARVVEHFAAGLQVQERLTQQVADWLAGHLGARRGRGARGRASVHDPARRPGPRVPHGDQRSARGVAHRCQVPRRVSGPHQARTVMASSFLR